MSGLRVLIADDHERLREGIVALLSSEFEVVGAVSDGEQLVQAALLSRPDVIVTDISMPVMDGFSARKKLLTKSMDLPFIFITMTFSKLPSSIEEDRRVGYVHKADLVSELRLAVQAVSSGRNYVSRSFRQIQGAQ